ncbi:DUF58 domain-containing protein [Halorussus halophilus]|uniref:DUF58 domain-containing protein n=1 Tax=Halorussus halophilus TaxID=2650975 RepID=UPI0013016BCE|nr:DUF58 domain-containing protein [Halorussus halophilus]
MTTTRKTDRWRGVVAAALFAGFVGLVGKRPLALLSAVVAVAFAVYPRVSPTLPVELDIERSVEEQPDSEGPADDGEVEVTVTIRNVGDRTLPDVRIIDGVPPMLSVVDGTARHAATLRPGKTTTFSYTVNTNHGRHQFDPATVLARDWSGATEVETTVATETEIDCTDGVPDVPLRQQTTDRVGPMPTDSGGAGIEFYRTRNYQHGDPMSRIDWNRLASSGELTTVDFRKERATSVVVCLDARRSAYRANEDEPHAVAHGVAAAENIVTALLESREQVGLAAIGEEFCWHPPGAGADHGTRIRNSLATHPALSAIPPEEDPAIEPQVTELKKRLASDTQLIVISPLADSFTTKTALELEAAGTAVTVVSPDVTDGETPGGKIARAQRENEIHSLRRAGVQVVDWNPDEQLGSAIAATKRRHA